MTYTHNVTKGKLSVYILNNTLDQSTSSTSYVDYQIDAGNETLVNQFSAQLTVDDTNNRIQLPQGKFYLDARLMIKRASISLIQILN